MKQLFSTGSYHWCNTFQPLNYECCFPSISAHHLSDPHQFLNPSFQTDIDLSSNMTTWFSEILPDTSSHSTRFLGSSFYYRIHERWFVSGETKPWAPVGPKSSHSVFIKTQVPTTCSAHGVFTGSCLESQRTTSDPVLQSLARDFDKTGFWPHCRTVIVCFVVYSETNEQLLQLSHTIWTTANLIPEPLPTFRNPASSAAKGKQKPDSDFALHNIRNVFWISLSVGSSQFQRVKPAQFTFLFSI